MKTITVDQKGTGDFTKIQQALDDIRNNHNDTFQISILPGVYVESLKIINRNIELIGKENINETIIENSIGESITVNVKSKNVKIRNLCIRQTHFSDNFLKKSYALALAGEFFEIDYCNIISSQGGISAFLSNNLIIRSCNIISRDECGIYLDEYGKVTIEYNDIQSKNGSGISIFGKDGFNNTPQMVDTYKLFQEVKNHLDIVSIDKEYFPNICSNKIHNCESGIFIDGGSCLIYNNEIYNNELSGVFVYGGTPTIRNNKIYNNHSEEQIYDRGKKATLENNSIF